MAVFYALDASLSILILLKGHFTVYIKPYTYILSKFMSTYLTYRHVWMISYHAAEPKRKRWKPNDCVI